MKELWPSDQKPRHWHRGVAILAGGLMLLSFGIVSGMGVSGATPHASATKNRSSCGSTPPAYRW